MAGWYGVVSAASPRVAAQDAPQTKPHPFDDTVCFHGLNEVGGAAGSEPAPAIGAGNDMERHADEALVEQHGQYDKTFQHVLTQLLVKCLRLSRRRKSFSSSVYEAVLAVCRGMSTT